MQVALFAMCCGPITPSVAQGIAAQSVTTVIVTNSALPVAVAFEDSPVPVADVATRPRTVSACTDHTVCRTCPASFTSRALKCPGYSDQAVFHDATDFSGEWFASEWAIDVFSSRLTASR